MQKNKAIDKNLPYKIILVILVILLSINIGYILNKQFVRKQQQTYQKEILDTIRENNLEQDMFIEDNEQKFKIIGIIEIPKINLQYPIIDITDNNLNKFELTKDINQLLKQMLNLGIVKFYGANINEVGNCTIAGHNNLDGTFFGKAKNLNVGDNIYLTNTQTKEKREYIIYDMFKIDANDTSILKNENSNIETTLITCTNFNKQRLVIKARVNN